MKGRVIQLDVLRMIAVLLVICRHSRMPGEAEAWYWKVGFRIAHSPGWSGVDLFFVLSGFLVSGLLFREYLERRDLDVKRFLIRRGLKLYPAFYCMIAATFCAILLVRANRPDLLNLPWPGNPPLSSFLVEALFVQNYLKGFWGHTWSLAVEEHFYFGIAILLWAQAKKHASDPFRGLVPLFIALAVFQLLLRWMLFPSMGYDTLYRTHLRFDALLFGVVLSYLASFHADHVTAFLAKYSRLVLVASVVLIAPAFLWNPGENRLMASAGLTATYIAYGGFTMLALRVESAPSWLSVLGRWLGALGVYSYSIYLWHMGIRRVLYFAFLDRFHVPFGIGFLLNVVLTFAFGIFMAKLIEIPVLKFRDRFFPSSPRKQNSKSEQTAETSAAPLELQPSPVPELTQ